MTVLPQLAPLDIQDPRMSTRLVHERLRELIWSGELPGGTVVSQVQLSAALGVSRTPLREAFRMLQEEGLIEGELNQRCRVAAFDTGDLDALYGTRLLLEALGMRLTLPSLQSATLDDARAALAEMEADPEPPVSATWRDAHLRFHEAFTSGAPEPFRDQTASAAHRSSRYLSLMGSGHPSCSPLSAQDHRTILLLVSEHRDEEAVVHTARHLARTALVLLADIASEFEPVIIRNALALIAGRDRAPGTAAPVARLHRRSS